MPLLPSSPSQGSDCKRQLGPICSTQFLRFLMQPPHPVHAGNTLLHQWVGRPETPPAQLPGTCTHTSPPTPDTSQTGTQTHMNTDSKKIHPNTLAHTLQYLCALRSKHTLTAYNYEDPSMSIHNPTYTHMPPSTYTRAQLSWSL